MGREANPARQLLCGRGMVWRLYREYQKSLAAPVLDYGDLTRESAPSLSIPEVAEARRDRSDTLVLVMSFRN